MILIIRSTFTCMSPHGGPPLSNDSVVLHAVLRGAHVRNTCSLCGVLIEHSLAHAKHSVDLLDAEPMEDVRHQSLESHVLYACNVLSALEVV